jgi:mono/diheme cytochrome c family protein
MKRQSAKYRIGARVVGCGFVALVAIQFIRPAITHPPVTADLAAPAQVKEIFRKSCYDCHSNETKLAWFDEIVPGYWLVSSDVKEARRHLNFSEIGTLPPAQQKGALYDAVNQIQLLAMPLPSYARLHRRAAVTPAELSVLKDYLNPPVAESGAATSDLAADDAQYQQWIREGGAAQRVAAVPNGIEFPADYKNWKAIGATDRFDNGTMRMILSNDVGVQAIAANSASPNPINPWPDGTAFAKVAWIERDDGQGQVRAGAFLQVEFMLRDSRKYAATKGWGWARWRGAGLTPYGKNAEFTAECVGCHAPLRNNDYVFTVPLRGQAPAGQGSALTGDLPANPLAWRVITSTVDKRSSTMSTLYGNDAAVQYARAKSQQDGLQQSGGQEGYPAGAVISLVTWTQQEDAHWFGAKMLGQAKSVEFVSASAGPDNHAAYSYEDYEGSPLRKMASQAADSLTGRVRYLLSLRASVMP